ncbi:MAG: GNAT family N-acetyltransferase [Pseudomonadota bacterium]
MIPTLQTERLTLTAPGARHFAALADFYADDRSSFVGGPLTAERSWRVLAAEIGHWTLRGYGRFAVELTETGEMVGLIGPWNPHGWPEPELGWDLMNGHERKGYATEAALATRSWAYGTLGWSTVISLVAEGNGPSAALARRMGCTQEGPFTHEVYGTMNIWRHPGPEALA